MVSDSMNAVGRTWRPVASISREIPKDRSRGLPIVSQSSLHHGWGQQKQGDPWEGGADTCLWRGDLLI